MSLNSDAINGNTAINGIKENSTSSPTSVVVAQHAPHGVLVQPMGLNDPYSTLDATNKVCKQEPCNTTKEWTCPTSAKSMRTINPIRAIVDPIVKNMQTEEERGDGKYLISLALGDPTVGGNFPPYPAAIHEIVRAVSSKPHAAGYVDACGTPAARQAIAQYHSYPEYSIQAKNVVVANGCSGALELALTALLDPGTILLVPEPGFPLYQVIAESHGANVLHYRLDPDRKWETHLDHLEAILKNYQEQSIIRGIVINNPSNPTGAVFRKSHLVQMVELCHQYKIPIISDEVYGDLAFGVSRFHPLAQVSAQLGRHVPVITARGLAKEFLLPGWRVGWIVFHDNKQGSLAGVEAGAKRLAQVVLGASHLVQSVIPTLLKTDDPLLKLWKQELRDTLHGQAVFLCNELKKCSSLQVIAPQGAMYAMVRLLPGKSKIRNDIAFSSLLLEEENIFVLPGSAFGSPNSFRVAFCSAKPILKQAAQRIQDFCHRYQIEN